MRTVTKKYRVFKYQELCKVAQDRVISEHIQFLLDVVPYEDMSDNFKKAIDKAEELRTPWFTASIAWEYCKDEILADIKDNKYEYTSDGKIFS
jgi:hypothetical protein